MLISELMIPEFTSEAAMTRRLLERIPADKLGWTPKEGLHTIGWNASHLVEIVSWVPATLTQSEIDMAPVGGEPYVTPEVKDVPSLLSLFDSNVKKSLAALKGVSDAVMAEPWSLKMGGQTLFTISKNDCLRKWVFSHTAHHRGILSTYLKLAGVQFSSLYEE
jgi:uncharacterized damage-inducible protein DinB